MNNNENMNNNPVNNGNVNPNPNPVNTNPVPGPAAPIAPVPEAAPETQLGVTEVPTGNEDIAVVDTEKRKTSSIVMIILVAILILFVLNMDKIIEIFDNFTSNGSISNKTNNDKKNNLVNGYILIGDSTSGTEIDKIKFYNFKKREEDSTIIYNYESSSKYSDTSSLNLYIEIYNSDKEILYREQFNVEGGVEKDSVENKSIVVTSDVLESAYYALVKKDSGSTNNVTTLTCKYNSTDGESTLNYNIIYTFKNDGLTKYIVNKQIFNYDSSSGSYKALETEYNSASEKISAIFQSGSLNYTVDFDKDLNGFTPLYEKGSLSTIIKNKEKLKGWVCE